MSEKKSIGWGWIILALIVFWPVGLILVIYKFATDRKALMSGKTVVLSVIGWCLAAFGTIGILGRPANGKASMVIVSLLFMAGGSALISKASKIKKTAAKYRKYIDIVVNMGERNIGNIASAFALPYDVALKDLQDMIDTGYLKDAYIHRANREIILKQAIATNGPPPLPTQPGMFPPQTAAASKTVRCTGCGANNVITIGKTADCEYCGTPINS